MKKTIGLTSAVGLLLILGATIGTVLRARASQGNGILPPDDLIKLDLLPGTSGKAVYTDLKKSWYNWATLDQVVTVKRRERADSSSPWSESIQELSTSYYPVDVRWRCSGSDEIDELYVAGLYPNGDSCVERWRFKYGLSLGGAKRLPRLGRTELFRGSDLGMIRCVEPDPDGRFLLLLTYETPALYRLDLADGTVSLELQQSQVPVLSEMKHIYFHQHLFQGRMATLGKNRRSDGVVVAPRNYIVLIDSDNDGVFAPPAVFTLEEWESAYEVPGSFIDLCP